MSADKYYTETQLLLENWINQLDYRTDLEVYFEPYTADIFCPELNVVIEIDGPQHYKKAIEKRDKYLIENSGVRKVLHFKTSSIVEENEKLIKTKLLIEFDKIEEEIKRENIRKVLCKKK